ncbi:MAG: ribosome biogenesis GTPase YlqF [Gammaproteobacteria bacterium]|nr:ribosome biogenesis GTPase YlqF [Gammaproteobacteria bacterium]
MAVQWFPGHMHKARKSIKEAMGKIDIVIEVLDARIPYSSENPLVANLRQSRPCIKVLNKSDLADPQLSKQWISHFEQQDRVKAVAVVAENKGSTRSAINQAVAQCKKMLPERNYEVRPVRIMIMGIPNVGKSTIINALTGRNLAKTGNEPAVTKTNQMIRMDDGVMLCDTPGILWPKIEDEDSGYLLALTGAVKNTAIEFEDIASYAAAYLLQHYPAQICARYKLTEPPKDNIDLLEIIARKRGGVRAGGKLDMNKAAEVLLHDYRAGALGNLTLESPQSIQQRMQVMAERKAAEPPAQDDEE